MRKLSKRPELSDTGRNHLKSVIERLNDVASDVQAQAEELEAAEHVSGQLESALATASGVYVYTYPHYWAHPNWTDPTSDAERFLLKVGRTTGVVGDRIRNQVNASTPEAPLLLRVYCTDDPTRIEAVFHRLLDAAGHARGTGGKEWFSTTIEFCDEIARTLGLETLRGSRAR